MVQRLRVKQVLFENERQKKGATRTGGKYKKTLSVWICSTWSTITWCVPLFVKTIPGRLMKRGQRGYVAFKTGTEHQDTTRCSRYVWKLLKVSAVSRVQWRICSHACTCVCKPTCVSTVLQMCAHFCNTARELYISHHLGSTCFLITYFLCLFLIFPISS